MRKRVILSLVCLSALLLSGCGTDGDPPASAALPGNSTVIGENGMDHIEMTNTEIELLCRVFQGEDRIREGKLFSHQEEGLRQLRAASGYLDQKYPGHSFVTVAFEPATKFNLSATLTVEDGREYTVRVQLRDDGGYDCSDNCYGKYLQPRYDQYLEKTLADSGYTVKTYTRFPAPSDVLGPETTVEQLLQQAPKQTRSVDLFFVAEDHDAAGELQALMTQAGLYGTYTVYFVPELDDIQALEDQRSGLEYALFSCFDL